MRRILFILLALTIVASGSKGLASTDCEKWLAEYKQELAHKASVQRALAARQRARNYAHRKVGELIAATATPKPHPTRISSTRPHLTPAQMLKRFDVLCGELPVEPTNQVLDARMSPDEFISEVAMGGPVDSELLPPGDNLIAGADSPSYVPEGTTPEGGSGTAPLYPVYGPVPTGGFIPPTPPIPPVPPVPPIPPVPEPSSIVLLFTGVLGAAGSLTRRRLAAR